MADSYAVLVIRFVQPFLVQYLTEQMRKEGDHGLTRNIVKAQDSTTKRTGITIPQQYRWHKLIDAAFEELRTKNTGFCPKTRQGFGELMYHFIL